MAEEWSGRETELKSSTLFNIVVLNCPMGIFYMWVVCGGTCRVGHSSFLVVPPPVTLSISHRASLARGTAVIDAWPPILFVLVLYLDRA